MLIALFAVHVVSCSDWCHPSLLFASLKQFNLFHKTWDITENTIFEQVEKNSIAEEK